MLLQTLKERLWWLLFFSVFIFNIGQTFPDEPNYTDVRA
jgi:hypothetical protein